MSRARRAIVSLTFGFASLGTIGVALAVPAAASSCNDNWQGPTSGTQSWNTPADWSSGTPGSNSVVCITLAGTYVVDLTGSTTITSLQVGGGASGTQTLEVDGSSGSTALDLAAGTTSTVAANGVLNLNSAPSGYAQLGGTTALVTNSGTVSTSGGGGSQAASLEVPLTNNGTATFAAPYTNQDSGTLTTNSGTLTVASGSTLALSGSSSFTQAAGTLQVTGAMSESSGTFTASGGTESGNAVALSGTTLADTAGGGGYDVVASGTLTGTIPAGQTVTVDGSNGDVQLAIPSAVTDKGTLTLVPTANGYADITNTGGVTVASGATLSSSGASGSQAAYIETPVTNNAGGTVTLAAPANYQDDGTLTTNSGNFTVTSTATLDITASSSFTQSAGTITSTGTINENSGTYTQSAGTESGHPIVLSGSDTLVDTAGPGGFDVTGSSTLTGTIPASQTVTVDGSAGDVDLSIPSAVTDDGTLALDPTASGYAEITSNGSQIAAGAGVTVASGAVLSSTAASGAQAAFIETPVSNSTNGTITLGAVTNQDAGTPTTNSGNVTITSTGDLSLSAGSSFTQTAGTLKVTGAMSVSSGTFTASGGTESGNAVVLSSTTLADTAGGGGYDVIASGTLTGTIPAGQTVTVDGRNGDVQLAFPSAVTDRGTLTLASTASGYADITNPGGVTVTSGATLSTSGASGSQPAYIETPVTNNAGGTITLGAQTTDEDEGTLTTNSGSFTVSSGDTLNLTSASSFTQSAGTITSTGTIDESSGTFTDAGGAQSGNPVVISGTTLADSAGTGSFDVTGGTTLSGTIPAGQTVTVDGSTGDDQLALPNAVTDRGTLALVPTPSGYSDIVGSGGITVASGGHLTTSAASGSQPAYIESPVTNNAGGTITVGDANTLQDEGTLTANSGTLQVTDGGGLTLSGSSTLTESSTGTLGVTVNGTSGNASGITGPGVTLAGTLAVTTVGAPALGSTFTPIAGPVTGTFSALSFGPDAYTVLYPSGSVQLTTQAPFTSAATPFSAHQDVATGAVQVASIGSAGNGSGTYSATVNWGDGSAAQAATVNISGNTGTVVGPTHTYTKAGTFHESTAVANTDGTTITTTESVVVPALAVTAISPTSGPTTGGTTVTITGTGFTGATNVVFGTVAGTSITVVSDTKITVVSPAQAAATHNIYVTTAAGTSGAVPADDFTYVASLPAVTSISPTSGPTTGGTTVTITGTGFTGATKVDFGTVAGTSLTVVSSTKITIVSPAQAAATHNVYVTTPSGTSGAVAADDFTYATAAPAVTSISPTSGPTTGGTTVTITGTGFTGATKVDFGTVAGTSLTVVSSTKITIVSPAQAAATHNVYVTTPSGTSGAVAADDFTYS